MSIVIKWSVKAGLTFIQEVGNVRPDESLEQRHHLEHSPETGDGGGEVHIHCRLLNSSLDNSRGGHYVGRGHVSTVIWNKRS